MAQPQINEGQLDLSSAILGASATAVTQASPDNSTSIATTAFVKNQAYAAIADPTFTGDPKAPTATPGDNDTSIATTAFVTAAVSAGGGAPTTGEVLSATAGASAGAVGTYAFGIEGTFGSTTFGTLRAGNTIGRANADGGNSGSLSGTWRCLGYVLSGSPSAQTTLWLRVS